MAHVLARREARLAEDAGVVRLAIPAHPRDVAVAKDVTALRTAARFRFGGGGDELCQRRIVRANRQLRGRLFNDQRREHRVEVAWHNVLFARAPQERRYVPWQGRQHRLVGGHRCRAGWAAAAHERRVSARSARAPARRYRVVRPRARAAAVAIRDAAPVPVPPSQPSRASQWGPVGAPPLHTVRRATARARFCDSVTSSFHAHWSAALEAYEEAGESQRAVGSIHDMHSLIYPALAECAG